MFFKEYIKCTLYIVEKKMKINKLLSQTVVIKIWVLELLKSEMHNTFYFKINDCKLHSKLAMPMFPVYMHFICCLVLITDKWDG